MFTQPCFIRRNTPDLREKLRNLGHSLCPCTEFEGACWLSVNPKATYTIHGIGYTSEEEFPGKTQKEFLDEFLQESEKKGIVDCKINEDLFLALAALRDDTWKNQWMVVPKIKIKRLSGYFPQMCGRDGHYMDVIGYDWTICQEPNIHQKIQSYIEDGEDEKFLPHKATVEEIIEHFKE